MFTQFPQNNLIRFGFGDGTTQINRFNNGNIHDSNFKKTYTYTSGLT